MSTPSAAGRIAPAPLAYVRRLTAVLFVVAVPLALLLTNVRIAVSQPLVYAYSLDRYGAAERTGIDRSELGRAARELIAYLGSGHVTDLDLRVTVQGRTEALFNRREVLHMRDVRELLQRSLRVQELLAVYAVGYIVTLVARDRRAATAQLSALALRGGVLTVGLFGAAGIAVAVAFHPLFNQFHVISFSNDYWMLDPRTDRLIQMFPDGFWLDVTAGIALFTLMEGALISLVASSLIWRRSRSTGGPGRWSFTRRAQ